MGDDRDTGIEFGDLQDDLAAESYPLSAEELMERHGDRRLEHANVTVPLRELLEDGPEATYESADDVHRAVLDVVDDYVERGEEYADREPNVRDEDFEQQSF